MKVTITKKVNNIEYTYTVEVSTTKELFEILFFIELEQKEKIEVIQR